MLLVGEEFNTIESADVGDVVWDDLEGRNARIVKIADGAYWLGTDTQDGYRAPWEISPPNQFNDCWPFFEEA